MWLAADLLESKAWALYRERLNRFASLIGDREPVVLFRQLPGMGRAKRYIIALADDDRAPLDKFCAKLTAAGNTCDVMRNEFGPDTPYRRSGPDRTDRGRNWAGAHMRSCRLWFASQTRNFGQTRPSRAAGLLLQQGVPPHATYLFKHALV